MDPAYEVDHVEAAESKELALRLALGLVFLGLAYLGVADVLHEAPMIEVAPAQVTR